jgi:hypothetical protein
MLSLTQGPLHRAFFAWEYSLQQNMKRKSNYKCNQEETQWSFLQHLLEKISCISTSQVSYHNFIATYLVYLGLKFVMVFNALHVFYCISCIFGSHAFYHNFIGHILYVRVSSFLSRQSSNCVFSTYKFVYKKVFL